MTDAAPPAYLIPILIIIALGIAAGFHACLEWYADVRRDRKALGYYRSTFPTRNGSITLPGGEIANYHMLSTDGGATWWDVERPEGRAGYRIVGPARRDVLERMDAFDRLVGRVRARGPLDPSDPADWALMEEAGFTAKSDTVP